MGGGSKKFLGMLRGVQKSFATCEGGSKKFDAENFQLPSPPHQSIYEHSLNAKISGIFKDIVKFTMHSSTESRKNSETGGGGEKQTLIRF